MLCDRSVNLSWKQKRFCHQFPFHLIVISESIAQSIELCQKRFENKPWNCTVYGNIDHIFGPAKIENTKEIAYVRALTTASIIINLAESCAEGRLSNTCGCLLRNAPMKFSGSVEWNRCSDNIWYANKFYRYFSRIFSESSNNNKTKISLTNQTSFRSAIHRSRRFNKRETSNDDINNFNKDLGRQIATRSMALRCACIQWYYGKCVKNRCAYRVTSVKSLERRLTQLYDQAVHFTTLRQLRTFKNHRQRRGEIHYKPLIYSEESPNYCEKNRKFGWPGVHGRVCFKNDMSVDGFKSINVAQIESNCSQACCGKFSQTLRKIQYKCDCKFQWCCQLKCKICERLSLTYTCN
ncbi:hypothetical protein SNEBB_008269 [Seison nebaliae]|nr:hypothetical protein SNEBB_008269 [Seison nebaliae]